MNSRSILSGIYAAASVLLSAMMVYVININYNFYQNFNFREYFLEHLVFPTLNILILGLCAFALIKDKSYAILLSIIVILINSVNLVYKSVSNFSYDYYDTTEAASAILGSAVLLLLAVFLTYNTWKKKMVNK